MYSGTLCEGTSPRHSVILPAPNSGPSVYRSSRSCSASAICGRPGNSLDRAVALAKGFSSIVLAVSVGNENMVVWSFNKIAPDVMAGYIRTVRNQITQPVTTDDNYLFWASAPTIITDVIDFASLHTYSELDTVFDPKRWDWKQTGVPAAERAKAMMDGSIAEARRQYNEGRAGLDSKGLSYIPITIGETGWNAVDLGQLAFRAHPVNQKMYLDRLATWAAEGKAGAGPKAVFYFEASTSLEAGRRQMGPVQRAASGALRGPGDQCEQLARGQRDLGLGARHLPAHQRALLQTGGRQAAHRREQVRALHGRGAWSLRGSTN